MAVVVEHSSSTQQMSGSASADHILDGNYGFQTSSAIVKVGDKEHNLFVDGQTLVSDGTFVMTTNASKKLIFGTDSTMRAQFTTDGAFDLLSSKLLLNGNGGSANQVLKTDGYGNVSWTDQPTQQYAFGNITVSGQNTLQADTLTDTLDIVAGSGITISTDASNDRITISSSAGSGASNAFKTITVGATNVVADSSTDTLTLVAGNNVSIAADSSADKITISATTDGDTNQNAFTSLASSGQSTVTANQATDTLNFESEDDSSSDDRYADDRDKVTISTDNAGTEIKVTNNIPKTFSMASKVPITTQSGTNVGMPLRNKFYNVTTSGMAISGGGTALGVSTRALELTNSGGTTTDVLMPAKSDNSTLQLSILDSSGSTHVIDMDVAE